MPRYVILRHEMPADSPRASHWDFMLEQSGGLRTWALDDEPRAGSCVAGESLPDHRLDYLCYEGPVSGDRGRVARWTSGDYRIVERSDERWTIDLLDGRCPGRVTLQQRPDDVHRWMIVFAGS